MLYLGDACAALGDRADARRHWADAATVAEEAADEQGWPPPTLAWRTTPSTA
ncbi:hypothetical protein ABZU25_32725 [Micromonospora sp. NPDC005215]|uniref:hypothetical protein n=1 Tax=Micromonospora sp. NPDC005215 TaxID=3157024 RepID=UPI0033BABF5F